MRQRHPAAALWIGAKKRAALAGLEFTIDRDETLAAISRMTCEATGLPLSWDDQGLRGPWLPSIDRIDPTRGYVKGNTRITCWAFNRAKSSLTDDQFMTIAAAFMARATAQFAAPSGQ